MKENQHKKDDAKKKTTRTNTQSVKKTKKTESLKVTKGKSKLELYDLETGNADLEKTIRFDSIDDAKDKNKEEKSIPTPKTRKKAMSNDSKNGFNIPEVIIIIIIALCIGGIIGGGLVHYYSDKDKGHNFTSKKLNEFIDTYEELVDNYYKDVDEEALAESAIKGMLDYLGDEYSIYIDSENSIAFNEELEGKLVGIGAEITRNIDGTIEVTYPFEDAPAYKAGIQRGDLLLKVDDEDITNLDLDEISSRIKGTVGTSVKLTVKRDDKELTFDIVRKEVAIPSVISAAFERNNKKIGYLRIRVFAKNTYEQFKEKLEHLEENKIDSLIIDVRNNSGGHLDVVRNIASLFLEKNKIVYQLDTKGIVENIYSTSKESRNYSIAVLINGASASASEILAAALEESYGADVVGSVSYGKGTVQSSHRLSSGATIKYTHQKWLTPKGNWVDGVGIEPTLRIELSDEYVNNPCDENDNQLQRTIDLLSNK